MKPFLAAHWEKAIAATAFLLCVLSAVRNLVLGEVPEQVAVVRAADLDLKNAMASKQAAAFPPLDQARRVQDDLDAAPMSFKSRAGLLGYLAKAAGTNEITMKVGEINSAYDLGDKYKVIETSNPGPAIKWEEVPDTTCIRILALAPGKAFLKLMQNGQEAGQRIITILPKPRFDLYPPRAFKTVPDEASPGLVALTWEADPRTTEGMTLGYVIERREWEGGNKGVWQPVLGPGKMLDPAATRYEDRKASPNRKYEYRIKAIGDPRVTSGEPEKGQGP